MAPREIVEYRVPPSDTGVRIDRILRKLLPDVPLSRINRMLRRGDVRRAAAKVRGSDRAAAGDILTLALDPDDAARRSVGHRRSRTQAARLRTRLSGRGPAEQRSTALTLPVLYEDQHLIALDKPSGVAAHPGSSHPLERTVLGALLALTAGEGTATFRPSLVGRLDRDTSGVQLAGRSPEGLRGLEALSRSRGIRKTYLALVRGETLISSGRVDSPLRDRGSGRARMEITRGSGAGEAVSALTEYRVVARGGGASLVQVEPLTGRRHQIRAHLAHLGAPLAGDVRYGDRAWNSLLRQRAGLRRLFLHCAELGFKHPLTGARITISSPLPRELSAALTKLGIRIPDSPNL